MEPKLCACGCGQPLKWKPHHSQRPPKYIQGHFGRTGTFKTMKAGKRLDIPADVLARDGFCQCGCGERTAIAAETFARRGVYAGYPLRYIHGHHTRGKRGRNAANWGGGRLQNKRGYWRVLRPDHPMADSRGYILEHRVIWEEANGRFLRPDEHVHHVDGNPSNNSPENLVALTRRQHYELHAESEQTKQRKSAFQKARFADPAQRETHRDAARRGWETRRAGAAGK